MKTPDITQVQAAASAAALAGYAAGMRGMDFIAFVAILAVAIGADAYIRRGRAGIIEAAQYTPAGDDESDE